MLVELMLKAVETATKAGEIFIFKMPVLRMSHLAETMIQELAPKYGYDHTEIKIKIIGKRAGDKSAFRF